MTGEMQEEWKNSMYLCTRKVTNKMWKNYGGINPLNRL
jgi:hypothetical protein